MRKPKSIAILYQAYPAPARAGAQKPMKPGGYSDSGADIALALKDCNYPIVTPIKDPIIKNDLDWVFPDTEDGIQVALNRGVEMFWLNTVLYQNHPIVAYIEKGIPVVGQIPEKVDQFDDKYYTSQLLKENGLPIPFQQLISVNELKTLTENYTFPLVVKPVRGRGSQGVSLVQDESELKRRLKQVFDATIFGTQVYLEAYLPGQEITISVMPPGKYKFGKQEKKTKEYWCLPAVERFNHHNGIAPYSGVVAVTENSRVLEDSQLGSAKIQQVYHYCQIAAKLVNAKGPIRIDCRADENGEFHLFDLNLKPNMTGSIRPHRKDQDSLTALAARKIGWAYTDLILNLVNQSWSKQARNWRK